MTCVGIGIGRGAAQDPTADQLRAHPASPRVARDPLAEMREMPARRALRMCERVLSESRRGSQIETDVYHVGVEDSLSEPRRTRHTGSGTAHT